MCPLKALEVVYVTQVDHVVGLFECLNLTLDLSLNSFYLGIKLLIEGFLHFFEPFGVASLRFFRELLYNLLYLGL